MSLADWDVTKSHVDLTVAIESDRLKLDNDAVKASVYENYIHLIPNSDFNRGFTIGKIRTKLEITDFNTQFGTYEGMHGIVCMMSQSDVTGGAGDCYCFGLRNNADLQWLLVKFTAGLEHWLSAGATILGAEDDTLTPAVDTNYALELTWAYHTLIAGTRLVCKVGLADNNFTDLVTVFDVTDTATPLTTSVGEGIFFADMDGIGVGDLKRCYFDDTSIVPLAGIPF